MTIVWLSIAVFVIAVTAGAVLALSRPKRDENISLTCTLLQDNDLDWETLDINDLVLVNSSSRESTKECE